MKNLPYSTFSDFQPKNRSFKHPSTIKNEFVDIPNYRLASKAFDAQHLDKFLTRVNESESIVTSQRNYAAQPNSAMLEDEVLHADDLMSD